MATELRSTRVGGAYGAAGVSRVAALFLVALLAAGPGWAQQKSASSGGAYASYIEPSLVCLAEGAEGCLEAAMVECQLKAGSYEGCLEALSVAWRDGGDRVQAFLTSKGAHAAEVEVEAVVEPTCGLLDASCGPRAEGVRLTTLLETAWEMAGSDSVDWLAVLRGEE